MDNTHYTFKDVKVNERTFDVGVFVSYYFDKNDWIDEDGKSEEAPDEYPVVEDFALTDIYEQLTGGNQIVVPWDDPIRFDILEEIDYRIDEALVGITKQSNE